MKRIVLYVLTNFAVLLVLSITMQLLGIDRMLAQETGLNLQGLLLMAALFGFGGSFISLLISKWMAKMATGAHVVASPVNTTERWLVDTVKRQAKRPVWHAAVAIYEAPEINAFATGWNRNNALVAVSTGLLANMTQEEAEAVLGHEVTHVSNGDMVTLALIQGVVNTFVIFLSAWWVISSTGCCSRMARLRSWLLDYDDRRGDRAGNIGDDDRDVVLAPPRVSCGCGRRGARRAPENDRGAGAAQAQSRTIDVARAGQGVRNCRGR